MNTHRVAVLALDDVIPLDLAIPIEVFSHAPYRTRLCGPTSPVRTTAGFTINPAGGLRLLSRADTVVVPGYRPHARRLPVYQHCPAARPVYFGAETVMNDNRDPYAVLGVTPTATPAEIAHAFRAKLRALHPDTSSAAVGDTELRQVLAAYGLLRDPDHRADYDRTANVAILCQVTR
jgi:GR25 family glycosyltransferase involved in LPS biosynthesis